MNLLKDRKVLVEIIIPELAFVELVPTIPKSFTELLQAIPYDAFKDLTPKIPYDESKDKLFYIINGESVPAWKVEVNPQRYFRGN